MAGLHDLLFLLLLPLSCCLLWLQVTPTSAGRYVSLNTTVNHARYFLNDLGVDVKAKTLIFNLTAPQDAIVRLARKQTLTGQYCDVIIGSLSNGAISVSESCSGCNSLLVAWGTFLSSTEPSSFWLDWSDDVTLKAGQGSVLGGSSLFNYTWQDHFEVNYAAASRYDGQEGQWKILIDTPPYFASPKQDGSTVITVPESAPINTAVTTISAFDHEADPITVAVIGQHSDMFVTHGSGVLLKENLDFETDQWFLVTLSCRRGFTLALKGLKGTVLPSGLHQKKQLVSASHLVATDGRHNTTATFTLRVSDVNDESPVLTSGPVTSLLEERSVGDVVAGLFAATDRDQGDNMTYHLLGNHSSYFTINETSGEVIVAQRLNREDGLSVLDDLRVMVTDSAGHSTELQLVLKVIDVNDNRPQFENDVYNVNVTTSLKPDVPFLTLLVTDADEGDNGDVSLTLVTPPGAAGAFWASGAALHVNVSGLQPRRAAGGLSSYTLAVEARDSARQGAALSAFAVVHVWVQADENYPGPVWVRPAPDASGWLPQVSVSEDAAPGTVLVSLSARDDDVSHFGDVSYALTSVVAESGLNASNVFSLDSTSGELWTARVLDRDLATGGEGFYVLTVQALTDLGPSRPPPVSEVKVKVTLRDVNDNAPTLNQSVYVVDGLSCSTQVGTRILSLRAADSDSDAAASPLTYSFVGDGAEERFALDAVTGDVTLKSNITAAGASVSHMLTATVRDGGTPEMTSSAAVVVVRMGNDCGGAASSGNSDEKSEQDVQFTNRVLTLVSAALGLAVIVLASLLCIAKVKQTGPSMPVKVKPATRCIERAWTGRQHTEGSVTGQSSGTASSSGSQHSSNADTQLTDCSSLQSLSLV